MSGKKEYDLNKHQSVVHNCSLKTYLPKMISYTRLISGGSHDSVPTNLHAIILHAIIALLLIVAIISTITRLWTINEEQYYNTNIYIV